MSKYEIASQAIALKYDTLTFNGGLLPQQLMPLSESLQIFFTGGALADTTSQWSWITFNRMPGGGGNPVVMNFVHGVGRISTYIGAGFITSIQKVPINFRPSYPQYIQIQVANSMRAGATFSDRAQVGCMKIDTDGSITVGVGFDIEAEPLPFLAGGTHGNGILKGTYIYKGPMSG